MCHVFLLSVCAAYYCVPNLIFYSAFKIKDFQKYDGTVVFSFVSLLKWLHVNVYLRHIFAH